MIRPLILWIAIIVLLTATASGCTAEKEPAAAPNQAEHPAAAPSPVVPAQPAPTLSPAPSASWSPAPVPTPGSKPAPAAKNGSFPQIDHIVIVVEENHSYQQIVGKPEAPYMQSLKEQGALFTNAYAITHPSQPNYLALFSGSTQNVKDDSCKGLFNGNNLASELFGVGQTFAGYSEDMPSIGYTGCSFKGYARKHNPWTQFINVPKEANRPLTDFPNDFTKLPTVSFVIPNESNDMHSGTIEQADSWLKQHLGAYADWAKDNNSLLIVTWDEDNFSKENKIPLIVVGPMVKPGTYGERINLYNVLRTIEDIYGLQSLGHSAETAPITTIWK